MMDTKTDSTGSALTALATALLLAIVSGVTIFLCFGVAPWQAFWVMTTGAFGSWYQFSEVLVKTSPLLLTGLAVALAAKMRLWNIGCEGQFVMGAAAATGAALFLSPFLPYPLILPCVLLASILGGAFWGAIPGGLKAAWGVNEILTTLLLNYVAIIFIDHLYFGPWRDPAGFGFPGTAQIPETAWLPNLWHTRVHPGLFLGLAVAFFAWFVLFKTKWGFRMRVAGQGIKVARYAGISLPFWTVAVMSCSGGLAGFAGGVEICGIQHRLQEGLAVGYGYDGIIVAFLSRHNPLLLPFAALFLGALQVGGYELQSDLHLPASISQVLEAALLFGYLAGTRLQEYLIRRRMLQNPLQEPAHA